MWIGGVSEVDFGKIRIMPDILLQILSGTPGKVLDLITKRVIDTRNVSMFVLDEADTMIQVIVGRIRNFSPIFYNRIHRLHQSSAP